MRDSFALVSLINDCNEKLKMNFSYESNIDGNIEIIIKGKEVVKVSKFGPQETIKEFVKEIPFDSLSEAIGFLTGILFEAY